MVLFRRLSVRGRIAKKAPIIQFVLFSLLAQSCTAISGLSQKSDEYSSSDATVEKVNVEREAKNIA